MKAIKTVNKIKSRIDGKINSIKKKSKTKLEKGVKAIRSDAHRKMAKTVSKLASLANKRIKRIEANNLLDSPAYKRLVSEGKPRFSVAGKSFNELQTELSRVQRFINSETSTIRGINRTLREMADNTKIKYKNMNDLRAKAKVFFSLTEKVEEYFRLIEDEASAIDYHLIWEAVEFYVQSERIELGDADEQIKAIISRVDKLIDERRKDEEEYIHSGEWITI